MRSKSIVAAIAVAALLAVPAAVQAHPFTTTSGLFSGEMPQLGLGSELMAGPSGFSGQSAEGDYETKRLQFLSLSARRENTLGRANSDIAFQGNRAYQGNFQGFRIVDISSPGNLRQILRYEDCQGSQGDVVVYGNILTRSWDVPLAQSTTCDGDPVPAGWEGLHVFDISNPENPDLVASVATRCGSHTATGVPDPANNRLWIYNTPSYSAGNCPAGPPAAGIQVVEIPLNAPESAQARQFEDAAPGINCHDTGVILGDVLRAACAGGDGIAVWTMDPAEGGSLGDPRLEYVRNIRATVPDFRVGHSAAWSNDGETLIVGHEPGGGVRARCQKTGTVFTDPTDGYTVQSDEMKSLFFLDPDNFGATVGKWTLPRDQSRYENCTLHNYNVVPTTKGDWLVKGSYQSGISVLDFSDLSRVREIGYADPARLSERLTGPPNPNRPVDLGGDWSTHWYNGFIYQSDITRGVASWRFNGGESFKARELNRLNPQTQTYTTE